ncbi:MAG: DUF1987 domain-containing protein [Bacteroidales bacterium]|nr:DUF1987 domain-containing protein [Bacteroidales bacterium]
MESIVYSQLSSLPEVNFSPDGKMLIKGRSIPEDASEFYSPLIQFVDELQVESAVLDIDLEYFNTASSKKILDLLRHLDANNGIKNILVNWHFEEGDDDSVETAEIYEESLLRIDFRYHEYAEVA